MPGVFFACRRHLFVFGAETAAFYVYYAAVIVFGWGIFKRFDIYLYILVKFFSLFQALIPKPPHNYIQARYVFCKGTIAALVRHFVYTQTKMLYNSGMTHLKPDERLEDLQCGGLQLIQSSAEYRFTTDAVLLANFCRDMRGKRCVELGAGSGVISLLVACKKHPAHITAVELQPQLADMMQRSVSLNGLDGVITVVCGDLKQARQHVAQPADVVICNPPYRKLGSGDRQQALNLALCRHEIAATLADVVHAAADLLNNRGSLYLVHQADRLCELVALCAASGIAVKEILPVCPSPGRQPNLVLVRAVKGGGSDCTLRLPICVCDEQGNYTPQTKAWYGLQD